MANCGIVGCQRKSNSRGWCKPHYDAWIRHGDPNTYRGDRSGLSVWEKIQEIGWTRAASGCLEYNGYRNELGYGQFRDRATNKLVRVHRAVYRNLVGELSDVEKVRHECDNPPCGEPSHLLKGTQADNIQDMIARGRNDRANWTSCPNGHEYPPDRPKYVSKNRCRVCANERNRRYHARKQERLNGVVACG